MLNTRDSMREGTNERTYTMTEHITTLLLHSRVKIRGTGTSIKLFIKFSQTQNLSIPSWPIFIDIIDSLSLKKYMDNYR